MHKPEPVLENETHKILRDFKVKTDLLISAKRPDLVLRRKPCCLVEFAVPADIAKMNESEKIDKNPTRQLKNIGEHESDRDTNCCWSTWNGPWRSWKETGGIGNQKNWNLTSDNIKIGKNTQQSPGDLYFLKF